jgi:hypothetical protein
MTLLLSKWKGQAFTRWIFWAKVDPHVVQVWGRFLARPVFVSPYRDPKKTFRTNFKNNKWRNNNPNNVKTPYDQQHKPFNYIFKKNQWNYLCPRVLAAGPVAVEVVVAEPGSEAVESDVAVGAAVAADEESKI